jgi:hypothetical protein
MKMILKLNAGEALVALHNGSLKGMLEIGADETYPVKQAVEEAQLKELKKVGAETPVTAGAVTTPAVVKTDPTAVVTPAVSASAAPAPAAPVPSSAPAAPAPAEPAPAPSYSIDDIQKAAVALVNKGKMTELQALLQEFNVSAITQLGDDPQVRAAFMTRIGEIGGKA